VGYRYLVSLVLRILLLIRALWNFYGISTHHLGQSCNMARNAAVSPKIVRAVVTPLISEWKWRDAYVLVLAFCSSAVCLSAKWTFKVSSSTQWYFCFKKWLSFSFHTLRVKKWAIVLLPVTLLDADLTDFQNSFTDRFAIKSAIKSLLNIPSHLNSVTTLPCEISMFGKLLYSRTWRSKLPCKTLPLKTVVEKFIYSDVGII